jgi:hypothetical protein
MVHDELTEEVGLAKARLHHADFFENAKTGGVPRERAREHARDVALVQCPTDDRASSFGRVPTTLYFGVDAIADFHGAGLVGSTVEHDAANDFAGTLSRDQHARTPQPTVGIFSELFEWTSERAFDERLAWPCTWKLRVDETFGRDAIFDEHGFDECTRDRHEIEAVCRQRIHDSSCNEETYRQATPRRVEIG